MRQVFPLRSVVYYLFETSLAVVLAPLRMALWQLGPCAHTRTLGVVEGGGGTSSFCFVYCPSSMELMFATMLLLPFFYCFSIYVSSIQRVSTKKNRHGIPAESSTERARNPLFYSLPSVYAHSQPYSERGLSFPTSVRLYNKHMGTPTATLRVGLIIVQKLVPFAISGRYSSFFWTPQFLTPIFSGNYNFPTRY